MKNGCNKKIIYSCDARRFDQEHCFFYEHADLDHCRHKYGERCISSEAQKHADGRGSEYPKPTEPGWYNHITHNQTKTIVYVDYPMGSSKLHLWGIDVPGGMVDLTTGTWGPRVPDWEPDE